MNKEKKEKEHDNPGRFMTKELCMANRAVIEEKFKGIRNTIIATGSVSTAIIALIQVFLT